MLQAWETEGELSVTIYNAVNQYLFAYLDNPLSVGGVLYKVGYLCLLMATSFMTPAPGYGLTVGQETKTKNIEK